MTNELIDLAGRLERMTRLDPALGEEAKAALLRTIGGRIGLDENPILDLTACNSLAGVFFGSVDVLVWYRIGRDGGRFLVTLRFRGETAAATNEMSLCAAFLAAMCRGAAEL